MKDRLGNEVPAEALPFARWLEQHGWHYLREYVPAGEYEDEDGELVSYEAYWFQTIWHEQPPSWPREDGIWFYSVSVSDSMVAHEAAWPTFLEFAKTCSEEERISSRVYLAPRLSE
jgi:hypothetical protein